METRIEVQKPAPALAAPAPAAENLLNPAAALAQAKSPGGPPLPGIPETEALAQAKSPVGLGLQSPPPNGSTPSSGVASKNLSSNTGSVKHSVNSSQGRDSLFSMSTRTGGNAMLLKKAEPIIEICREYGDFFGAVAAAIWAGNASVILQDAFDNLGDSSRPEQKVTDQQKIEAMLLVVKQWKLVETLQDVQVVGSTFVETKQDEKSAQDGSQKAVTVEKCKGKYEVEFAKEKVLETIRNEYKKEENRYIGRIADSLPQDTYCFCLKGNKNLELLKSFLSYPLEKTEKLMLKAVRLYREQVQLEEQSKKIDPPPSQRRP